ncbi:hypothetical protein [Galactobacter caseinivorans]|nr:hypothetical protein [Galactobacter caseinivorans]
MRPKERRSMVVLCAVILVAALGVYLFLTSGALGVLFDPGE